MNEKVIEVIITSKNVHMNNDHKTHVSVTSTEEAVMPLDSHILFEKKIKTRYADTYYYDNYTVTNIEATDIHNNNTYSLKIFKDDFLPIIGDTIKVCVNEENEIIAYTPYKNDTPVSTIKQHRFEPIDYYKSSFIIHAFPLTAPFYALAGFMPVKRFVEGKSKNSYFFAIFALAIIAIQVYSSYNLYTYGGDAFIKSIIGYLISGIIYISGMILFDLREFASKSIYINKIKQMLR